MKKWLIEFKSSAQPKARLFCFPFAGGGTVNYARWRDDLEPNLALYAFNFPGRERFFGEPCLSDYDGLIEQCTLIINELSELPLFLFGHSFGGLTAYFVALRLQHRFGVKPAHIYISARVPPEENSEKLSVLADEEFKRVLIERYQGIPQVILDNPDLLKLFIPIIKKDFYLYEQYVDLYTKAEQKIVDSSITSFNFTEDKTNPQRIKLWKNYTSKNYTALELAGGHFAIQQDWKAITEQINQNFKAL